MKRIFYLLIAGLLFTSVAPAQDFWTGADGPYGGTINDIVSPSAGVMLVSTANGVYRSTDSGVTWVRVTLGSDNSFTDLEVDPSSSGNKIYASTTAPIVKIYISTDAGVTWTQLTTTGVSSPVTKIRVASNGTTIYMTDNALRVLKSINSGTAFTTLQTFSGTSITDLDLDNLGNVYVSTSGQGIKVSNGVAAFTTPSTGSLTGTSIVYSTVIKSSTEIYCLSSNGAHKSVNIGGVYSLINTGLTADATFSGIIDVDASGNLYIFNNDFKKIYTSTSASAGALWTNLAIPFWSLTASTSYFQSSTSYYLGLGNIGVVKCTSGSWSTQSEGIKAFQPASSKIIKSVNYVYASGASIGYHESYGANWMVDGNGVTGRTINGFVKLSDNSILAYGNGVIRSLNPGSAWNLQSAQVLTDVVTSNGVNLFSFSGTNTLLASINQGVTWTTQTITGLPATPTKIEVDAANNIYFKVNNEIWKVPAATTTAAKLTALNATTIQDFQVVGNSVFVLGNGNTIFVSSNNGTSFISKNTPASASALWVHDATNMFLRTTANNFYLSKDAGGIWTIQPLLDTQGSALDAYVSDNGYLFVATSNSVMHRSTNYIIPPAAPTALSTIGKSFDRVELMWTDNANNEENYVIEYSQGNNQNYVPFELGINLIVNDTYLNKVNIAVSRLTKNTLYFFRVKATNSAGSSSYSNEISTSTLDQCPSTIPNNRSWTAVATADPGSTPSGPGPFGSATVNIVANGPNNFTISNFDFNINPLGSLGPAVILESCGQVYNVEQNTIPNGNGTWNGTNTLVLKWQDSPFNGAAFQGTTTFTLNAVDPVPATPSLNAYLYSGTEVLLNWNTIPFAVSYDIERAAVSGGPYTPLVTVNYPSITYLDKNLTTGLTYYYRIRAKNTASSAPSSEAGILLQNGLFRPVENNIQQNFENQQGVSWGDLDGDGDEDIASPSFTNNAAQTVPPVFYENMGNGKDFNRRDLSVLQNENTAVSRSINIFDFNNDGKLDMYISRSASEVIIQDLVLINQGGWNFTKHQVTPTAGTIEATFRNAAAADYDKDGLVDIFVASGNAQLLPDLLLKNSAGTSLIEIAGGSLTTDLGDSRNATWIDYDNDNDQDVFVINGSSNLPNRLYKNNGDGTFTRVTGLIFDTDVMANPRTISWGDIDNDGDFDLYVGSQSTSISPLAIDRLYQNNGNGTFTSLVGAVSESQTPTFGSAFGDIDNDGDLDLIAINSTANSIFLNNGTGTFTKYVGQEMANHPGINEIGGALADFDKDGFLDFYPSKGQTTLADLPNFLYRNLKASTASTNWIELKLVGTLSNKSAIGARVTVTTTSPARVQTREVSTHTGYGSANSLIVHVGLGTATAISTIQIKWPSGFVQNITNPTINQLLTVTEDVHADLTFTAPTSLDSKFGSTVFSVSGTANFGTISSVVLSYRKISGATFTDLDGTFNAANSKWEFTVNQSFFDGNGLEYYITAKSGSSEIGRLPVSSTTNFYTYLNYQEADNSIPSQHIGLGGGVNDWKVFSIPFDLGSNSNVTAIFDELAGLVDKVDWRMIAYKDEKAWGQFPTDFSTINRGKGYFINIKNSVDIKVPASTSSNNRKNLFQMDLKTGWNQIGNPYLSRINWEDVAALNSLTGTAAQLKTFSNGSYTNATALDPFEGGFVLAESNATISIPFESQVAPGGRKAESDLKENDWMLPVTLRQGSIENHFGGVGMREQALITYDEYDDFNAPPFIDFIEMNFDHPEHFVKKFARDVVPVQETYTWSFHVESNMSGLAELTWDHIGVNNSDKEIFLFDEGLQRVINMKEMNQYTFQPTVSKNFRIYYGENVRATIKPTRAMLSNPYPNPSKGETTIDFMLAESKSHYQVKLEVFDIMGKKITTLVSGTFNPGFYSASMDSRHLDMSNGLYTFLLSIAGEKGQEIKSQKFILNK